MVDILIPLVAIGVTATWVGIGFLILAVIGKPKLIYAYFFFIAAILLVLRIDNNRFL